MKRALAIPKVYTDNTGGRELDTAAVVKIIVTTWGDEIRRRLALRQRAARGGSAPR